ncbi:MAG: sodium:calcium antiporter [Cyanobacteria bacterium P01_H01_bin.74]
MFLPVLEVCVLLFLIVWVCGLFTNAVEWIGHRFNLSDGAVGSVLAAVGTALPETLVPVIAIVSGVLGFSGIDVNSGHDIGIGAILGAPFLLSTLALVVSATAYFYATSQKKRPPGLQADLALFRRDLLYFFPAYGIVLLASMISSPSAKIAIALGLVAFYAVYVYRTLKLDGDNAETEDLSPLVFSPKQTEPKTAFIIGQLVVSLLLLMAMVHFFVEHIHHIAAIIGIPELILSLVITPIATELPEKFNSVVWICKGKDNLALGNITGAMVFQSCIPTAIGVALTPWLLEQNAVLSIILCFISALVAYVFARYNESQLPLAIFLTGLICYGIFLSSIFLK